MASVWDVTGQVCRYDKQQQQQQQWQKQHNTSGGFHKSVSHQPSYIIYATWLAAVGM
jgi:hypothetical protein